jgi:hypothetical protein
METVGDNGTISYSLDNGTTFTALVSVYDIKPNKISVKLVETTKLASEADESQPGTPDYGEVVVTIATIAASTTLINGWIANNKILTFQVTMDDQSGSGAVDTGENFLGWVKEYEPLGGELKKDEVAKSSLTLKITGVPTFAAGTAGS